MERIRATAVDGLPSREASLLAFRLCIYFIDRLFCGCVWTFFACAKGLYNTIPKAEIGHVGPFKMRNNSLLNCRGMAVESRLFFSLCWYRFYGFYFILQKPSFLRTTLAKTKKTYSTNALKTCPTDDLSKGKNPANFKNIRNIQKKWE